MTITALEPTHTVPDGLPSRRPSPSGLRLLSPSSPRYVRPLRLVPPVSGPQRTAAAYSRGVQVTRRGRLVLTLTVMAVTAVIALLGAFGARPADAGPARGTSAGSVVVQPGDTLWAVALRAAPQADPRVTVDRIAKLNGITDTVLQPGQRLKLPAR